MTQHDTELFPFPDHELTDIEWLPDRVRVRDSLVGRLTGYRPLHIDVDIPLSSTPVPVVAWIHGGAWQWGSNKLHDGPVPSRRIRESLLESGIGFAAIDYRLSAEAPWPAALHDVKAGIRWLRHYAPAINVDPSRIAAWGESAGGHLAALLATTGGLPDLDGEDGPSDESSAIDACVNWYGASDLVSLQGTAAGEAATNLLGGDLSSARNASPVAYVSPDSAPMLLVHGARDSVIPYQQSEQLATAYQHVGAHAELKVIDAAGHAFAGSDPEDQIEPSLAFLRAQLLDRG